MKKIIIVQASLSPNSNTAKVALEAEKKLSLKDDTEVELIDLRKYKMEFCDGRDISEYGGDVSLIYQKLQSADAYVLAYPVYNFSFSGVIKNFIDIFSSAMDKKFVGLIHNSGGARSWNHGAGELIKVLAFHNRILTVQPSVHSSAESFSEAGDLIDEKVFEKLDEMIDALLEISK